MKGKLKERHLDTDGRITLKQIFKKKDAWLWTEFIRIRIGSNEYDSEISGFVKRLEYFEQLSNYQLLNKNWALLSQLVTLILIRVLCLLKLSELWF
jgi:hypothetical protein